MAEMPQPSSSTAEVRDKAPDRVRMLPGEAAHSAKSGVTFQTTGEISWGTTQKPAAKPRTGGQKASHKGRDGKPHGQQKCQTHNMHKTNKAPNTGGTAVRQDQLRVADDD